MMAIFKIFNAGIPDESKAIGALNAQSVKNCYVCTSHAYEKSYVSTFTFETSRLRGA